jgi:lysine/ornithine N-monooxygenase
MKKSKTIEEIEKLSGLHNEAKGDIMLDSELTGLHNEAKGDINIYLAQLQTNRKETIKRWEKALEFLYGINEENPTKLKTMKSTLRRKNKKY